MGAGPSRMTETIVGFFIPPASREEVLGDLHERFASPAQYVVEVVHTVPCVIVSRIRRTADPQIVLIQAFALYLSFLGAAWLLDGTLLRSEWGLIQLAIPAAMGVVGVIVEDAYARPGMRSAYRLARGPLVGATLAILTQISDLALPRLIMLCGCGMGFLLSCAVRMLFPPATDQLEGANAPAYWLQRAGGEPGEASQNLIRILKVVAAISAVAAVGTWLAERTALPKLQVIAIVASLLVAYQLSKRS
jgi:hypothetical protein